MKIREKSWLTKDTTLWVTLALTVFLGLVIFLVVNHYKVSLLDMILDPVKVQEALDSMDPNTKWVHIWITATLDVALPLAYGSLLAGLALRFWGHYM